MSAQATALRRNEQLTLADDLMYLGSGHLPVLDDDGETVVGVVSQGDLLRGALVQTIGYGQRACRKLLAGLVAREVMTTDPITTAPKTPLAEAARVFIERKAGCLPVMERRRLVGILTESDLSHDTPEKDRSSRRRMSAWHQSDDPRVSVPRTPWPVRGID